MKNKVVQIVSIIAFVVLAIFIFKNNEEEFKMIFGYIVSIAKTLFGIVGMTFKFIWDSVCSLLT